LTGPIPQGLAASTGILNINLSENDPDNDGSSGLDGEIPEFFGTFSSLRWLKLHGNRLQGEIPASLSDLSSLGECVFCTSPPHYIYGINFILLI